MRFSFSPGLPTNVGFSEVATLERLTIWMRSANFLQSPYFDNYSSQLAKTGQNAH